MLPWGLDMAGGEAYALPRKLPPTAARAGGAIAAFRAGAGYRPACGAAWGGGA